MLPWHDDAEFLHDIGKAIDREVEGVVRQLELNWHGSTKEHPVVVNTIASHHGDVEPEGVLSVVSLQLVRVRLDLEHEVSRESHISVCKILKEIITAERKLRQFRPSSRT